MNNITSIQPARRWAGFSRNRIISLGILVVIFIVLALLPIMMPTSYWITRISDYMRYGILAVAWVLFSGPTGYMSLASAAFYGLGFYMAAILNGPLPFALVVLVTGVLGFLVAAAIGALTLRLRGVYFCIFTFSVVLLLYQVVLEVERIVTHTRGRFVNQESAHVAFWALLIVFALTIGVTMFIRRSRYGLALQSIGEYEEAAAHSGINIVRTKVVVFAISAIFMAMAGAIVATRRSYIDPGIAFDAQTSFLPVLMAMFGGMGNLVGPVLGAIGFTALSDYLVKAFPDLFMLIFGVFLIVAIVFMPNGIIGVLMAFWRWIRGRIGNRAKVPAEKGGRRASA
jgi:branched-chain amino acid transport system permease protein